MPTIRISVVTPEQAKMNRITALLISIALFSPLSVAAESGTDDSAPQSTAPPWVNVALITMGNAPASASGSRAESESSDFERSAEQSVFWQIPEPEIPPASIWPRIREGFALPEVESRRVGQFERWYQKNPEYFERMIVRSGLFLHYIVGGR